MNGKRYYEPAQTYTWFDGENYLDNNGMVLVDPNDYNYSNGFFKLNDYGADELGC